MLQCIISERCLKAYRDTNRGLRAEVGSLKTAVAKLEERLQVVEKDAKVCNKIVSALQQFSNNASFQKAAVDRSVDNEREKMSKKLKVPWQNMDELKHDVLNEERFLMLQRLLVVQIQANVDTFPRISMETLFSGYLIGRIYFDWPSMYVLRQLRNRIAF